MTELFQRLSLVAAKPDVFKQMNRGVERETLRYRPDGEIAQTPHPEGLGAASANKWITTDFSESLLEFITPVSQSVDAVMDQLTDIHHFAQSKLGDEYMWPMSVPCYIGDENDIQLARYGNSNSGKMKTLYREGLKRRYGSLMQIISGVHFNFSFPETFWDALFGEQDEQARSASKSEAYFGLIRNYYRFGWLIPYFFGASPAICPSFLRGRKTNLPFEKIGKVLYLPHATSLRLSDLGYTNSAQSVLKIGFNSLDQYLEGVNAAIRTPSEDFAKIGVKVDGEYRQLNSNILQIENELYAPIRPKRVAAEGEKPSDALARGGVEYVEIRSLDVNPFSPVGIDQDQIRFLDLFLTWATLKESDPMGNCELECWRDNWRKVVIEGRKPGLALQIGCNSETHPLNEWVHKVLQELDAIAEHFDLANGGDEYRRVCRKLASWVDEPEKTLSGQFLERLREAGGLLNLATELSGSYAKQHLSQPYFHYSESIMEREVQRSIEQQRKDEAADQVDFDTFLADYFAYLQK